MHQILFHKHMIFISLLLQDYPQGIAIVGSNLYWVDPQSGPVTDTQVRVAPKTGAGSITDIYTGVFVGQPIVDGFGLATDGTKIYTADAVQGGVHSMNLDGSNLMQIGPFRYGGFFSGAHQNYLDVWGGLLYLAESAVATASGCAGLCSPGVYTHSASSVAGAFDVLIPGSFFSGDGPRDIDVDEDFIFVTQGDAILKFNHAGSLVESITSPEFHNLRGVLSMAGSLYVIDNFDSSSRVLSVSATTVSEPSSLALTLFAAIIGFHQIRRRS